MSTADKPVEGEIPSVESPEDGRKRRRFWSIWIAVNVLLTLVIVPGIFMLLGDAIVQMAEGSESARVQTGIGLYFIVAAATLCTLLPINVIAAAFGLLAATGRRRPAESDNDDNYGGGRLSRKGPYRF